MSEAPVYMSDKNSDFTSEKCHNWILRRVKLKERKG